MPDNLHKKQLDSKRISLGEPYEVRYWCKTLGCTEQELKTAVKAVGDSTAEVKEFLKGYLSR
jgi:hypothetical protein